MSDTPYTTGRPAQGPLDVAHEIAAYLHNLGRLPTVLYVTPTQYKVLFGETDLSQYTRHELRRFAGLATGQDGVYRTLFRPGTLDSCLVLECEIEQSEGVRAYRRQVAAEQVDEVTA